MTKEELLTICRNAKDVGQVRHEDFIDYIHVLESRKKVNDEWTVVEHAYMGVDGKLAMANEDHRKQSKRFDVEPPAVLADSNEEVTLLVVITSEIYGRRCGIATSRKKTGGSAGFGYGLLPGAGLASAEDIAFASAATARTSRAPTVHSSSPRATAPSAPAAGNGNGHGKGEINSPTALLAAVGKSTDYYAGKDPGSALPFLQSAIQRQLANTKWKWPNASQLDFWREAQSAALEYARAQKAAA